MPTTAFGSSMITIIAATLGTLIGMTSLAAPPIMAMLDAVGGPSGFQALGSDHWFEPQPNQN
jgi:hypothetical protein